MCLTIFTYFIYMQKMACITLNYSTTYSRLEIICLTCFDTKYLGKFEVSFYRGVILFWDTLDIFKKFQFGIFGKV